MTDLNKAAITLPRTVAESLLCLASNRACFAPMSNDALEKLSASLREALAAPVVQEWVAVSEKMPTPGMPVLACYKSGRKIIAFWTPANTVVVSDEDSDIGVYDEATDTWYDPEGWYECVENWDEFSSIFVDAGVVTHWMELPTAPQPKEPT